MGIVNFGSSIKSESSVAKGNDLWLNDATRHTDKEISGLLSRKPGVNALNISHIKLAGDGRKHVDSGLRVMLNIDAPV